MKCEAFWHDGRASGSCARDATTEVDGVQLCGPHAAGRRRSQKTQAAWYQNYEEKRQRAQALCEQALRLSIALGIKVSPHYKDDVDYDGRMVVPVEFLEALVKERIDEDS